MAEVKIDDELLIHAPVSTVWHAIKDPQVHARWHPYIVRITGEHRLGEVRTCKVMIDHRPGATSERCIALDEEWRITWVVEDDSTGFSRKVTDWQTGFDLELRAGGTLVTAHSTFRPSNVLVWLMSPLIGRRLHHTQRTILKRLQSFIELKEGR